MELKKGDTLSLPEGYKNTEIGVIPEDWDVVRLGDYISLKNGYALKSEYFSSTGPIVMTPGNFKLEGGLKFEEKNTIRYSGVYSNQMCFEIGDLLMVMTDLTPDCNLLGKSGIVNTKETILHNQRIGKISISKKGISKEFLNVYFNSFLFSKRMKSTATGSTVRHTSVPTINNSNIILPTHIEQKAIAQVLTDTDSLIQALEKRIDKKKLIKKGVMQKLLTPKDGWEEKRIDDCAYVVGGGTPSSFNSSFWNGDINWFTPTEIGISKYVYSSRRKISQEGLKNCSTRILPVGTVLLTTRAGIGDLSILKVEACTNQGFQSLIAKEGYNNEFLYYLMATIKDKLLQHASGSTFLEISPGKLKSIEITIPKESEQNKIAQILSDLDNEIELIEQKHAKFKLAKQGLMQQLLTGKIRLIKAKPKTNEENMAIAAEPNQSYPEK